jgi:hydroxypyruvate reductase
MVSTPTLEGAVAHSAERAMLRSLFDHAIGAVSPARVMPRILPAPQLGKVGLIAVGKAAASMAEVALDRIPQPSATLVVTRHGHLTDTIAARQGVEIIEAGHPYPDAQSIRAADRALKIAESLEAQDHLLVLLSGGGSALLAAPADGLSLSDKQATTRALLESGATIAEINCVRKHLSRIKGGRLALAAGPARVTTLIISDVPGDDPSFVSSGPTVADHTTLEMARDILRKYAVPMPTAVLTALENPANETPPADSLGLAGVETQIIARARDALTAAGKQATAAGYVVTDLGDQLQAEARHLGASHAALARRLSVDGKPRAIISGGETTVAVQNREGKGGRNLEYLLGLAIALDGAPGISALACDTDGIDGTEDAAGAVVVEDTLERARALGLDPAEYLRTNNAYVFFESLGDLVITGPTRTNVNDFRVILINGAAVSSDSADRRP